MEKAIHQLIQPAAQQIEVCGHSRKLRRPIKWIAWALAKQSASIPNVRSFQLLGPPRTAFFARFLRHSSKYSLVGVSFCACELVLGGIQGRFQDTRIWTRIHFGKCGDCDLYHLAWCYLQVGEYIQTAVMMNPKRV